LVEQRIENPRVGGSNPPPGTIPSFKIRSYALPHRDLVDAELLCAAEPLSLARAWQISAILH
jgi:hypothetical protein